MPTNKTFSNRDIKSSQEHANNVYKRRNSKLGKAIRQAFNRGRVRRNLLEPLRGIFSLKEMGQRSRER